MRYKIANTGCPEKKCSFWKAYNFLNFCPRIMKRDFFERSWVIFLLHLAANSICGIRIARKGIEVLQWKTASPKHSQCGTQLQFFGHNFLVNRNFSILTFAMERYDQKQSKSYKFDRFSRNEKNCSGKWKCKINSSSIIFIFSNKFFTTRKMIKYVWFDLVLIGSFRCKNQNWKIPIDTKVMTKKLQLNEDFSTQRNMLTWLIMRNRLQNHLRSFWVQSQPTHGLSIVYRLYWIPKTTSELKRFP